MFFILSIKNKQTILSMKTIRNLIGMKGLASVVISLFLFLSSCKENSGIDYSSSDNLNVQSEANSDAMAEEVDDMSAVAVSSDAAPIGGRGIAITDTRFACAKTINIEPALDNNPPSVIHGYITVDFGTGCSGPGGRVRIGIFKIEYVGKRFMPGSKMIITFDNYTVNGIKFDGIRTLTNVSTSETAPVAYSITEDGMILTYPDGSTATRSVQKVRTWIRTSNPLQDSWTVAGTAAGTNRKGKSYTMTITKDLIYSRACGVSNKVFIPVQGTKVLVVDNKSITIDYGNGDCDSKLTITINGRSRDVDASADGN